MANKVSIILGYLAVVGFLIDTASTNSNEKASLDADLGETEFDCVRAGNGAWPHPINCWQYYLCHEGVKPHIYNCRDNLLFSLNYYGCDFEDYTNCGERLKPGQSLPQFSCPSNGLHPLTPTSCGTAYYSCANGQASLKYCPGVDIFDSGSKTCVPAATAPCIPTVPTTPKPLPFECPAPSGYFVSPYTCKQFYLCQGNKPFLYDCPAGLYYNPKIIACDWPVNVPSCSGF